VTGIAELPAGTEMVMPGDNVSLVIELITPVAMEKGLRFAIREGGHTVGAGTIRGDCDVECGAAVSAAQVERARRPRDSRPEAGRYASNLIRGLQIAARSFFPGEPGGAKRVNSDWKRKNSHPIESLRTTAFWISRRARSWRRQNAPARKSPDDSFAHDEEQVLRAAVAARG